MLKKSLMFFSVVFLAGILILGCSSPTGPAGKDGQDAPGTGNNGSNSGSTGQTGGPVTISGDGIPTSVIQGMIDGASGTIYITKLTQDDDGGTIFIPANKNVVLTDTSGPTEAITLGTDGILIVEKAESLGGSGTIEDTSGIFIAPQSILSRATGGNEIALQSGVTIDTSEDDIAVLGNVAINSTATGTANILAGDLSDQKLYVVGNLTVSAAVTTTGGLIATGDVITTAAIESDVTAKTVAVNTGGSITGDVTTTGTVTTGVVDAIDGSVNAGGKVTFTAAQADIDALTAGSLEATALTTSGAVEIAGAAAITGTFTPSGNVTFKGLTGLGVVTLGSAVELGGAGTVVIGGVVTTTSSNKLTIKSPTVQLNAANTLASNLVAPAGTVIHGGSGTGVVLGDTSLAVGTAGSVVVPATGAGLVAGGVTGSVVIKGAELKAGTYTADNSATGTLVLAANTEIAVSGSVTIPAAGQITLAADTTKIRLLAGGSFASTTADGDIIKASSDHENVTLTVGTTGSPDSATKATVTDAPFVVTTDTTGTDGKAPTVGKIKWAISGATAEVEKTAGADADENAAGTLTAGPGTTITLAGKA